MTEEIDARERLKQIDLEIQKLHVKSRCIEHRVSVHTNEAQIERLENRSIIEKLESERESIEKEITHSIQSNVMTNIFDKSKIERLAWPVKLFFDQNPEIFPDDYAEKALSVFSETNNPASQIINAREEILETQETDIPNKSTARLNLVISVKEYKSIINCSELVESIKSHCELFNNVYIFLDECDEAQASKLLSFIRKDNVIFFIDKNTKMKTIFSTLLEAGGPEDLFLLAETKCIFNEDINRLKKIITYDSDVICMSRPTVNNYWSLDSICININTVHTAVENIKWSNSWYLNSNSFQQICSSLHAHALFDIRNVGIGNHVTYTIQDQIEQQVKPQHTREDLKLQWPYLPRGESIQNTNYICGDICGYCDENYMYDDRFDGKLGDYFVRDFKSLCYQPITDIAVLMMTSYKQLFGTMFNTCLSSLFEHNRPSNSSRVDMFICVNRVPSDVDIDKLHEMLNTKIKNHTYGYMVNDVNLINIDLSPDEDIFTYSLKEYMSVNKSNRLYLGGSHGINKQFFDCMSIFKNEYKYYDYILLLEPDCKVVKNCWLDELLEHIETAPDKLIYGSFYKGVANITQREHINGVAIYNNSSELHEILEAASKYITRNIQIANEWIINFDIAISRVAIDRNILNNKVVDTTFITNVSTVRDLTTPEAEVINEHPNTIILHKKS